MVINEAGWVAFGFIIFCIIAWRYGAKPFVEVLESRANEVKEKLAEAETLRNEAKEVLNNYKILQQEAAVEAKNIILRAEENAKHLQFIMEMALILLKRRGGNLSFYVFYIKVT